MSTSDTGTISSADLERWREQLRKASKKHNNKTHFYRRYSPILISMSFLLIPAVLFMIPSDELLDWMARPPLWFTLGIIIYILLVIAYLYIVDNETNLSKAWFADREYINKLVDAKVLDDVSVNDEQPEGRPSFSDNDFKDLAYSIYYNGHELNPQMHITLLKRCSLALLVVYIGLLIRGYFLSEFIPILHGFAIVLFNGLLFLNFYHDQIQHIWQYELSSAIVARLDELEEKTGAETN